MKWHLHVTVQPHWSWTLSDVASALQRDVERHGIKPVVITNHFRDSTRLPYRELIPTKHAEGDEADASRQIFHMGVLLNNAGWRVKRLKIEGSPLDTSVARRALYFETHLKNPLTILPAPMSTNANGDKFYTVRRKYATDLDDEIMSWHDSGIAESCYSRPIVEAAILDTNPAMDADWINQ